MAFGGDDMNKSVLSLFLAVFLILNVVIFSKAYAIEPNDPGFRVEVGEEEYVIGPSTHFPDGPFLSVKTNGQLRAYAPSNSTYTFLGDSLDSLSYLGVAIAPGTAGQFDECGAWLHSVYKITENHWIGWHHAEEDCNYTTGATHKSMGFVESYDAGQTWQRPNYPNNQVLTSSNPVNDSTKQDGAGDGVVLKIGDYFYMLYVEWTDWGTHLARSRVSDLGKPGTWYKYYNGSFSEPGLGGRSTNIVKHILSSTTYNSYLDKILSIRGWGRTGFYLLIADKNDLTRWNLFPSSPQLAIFPLVSYLGDKRLDNWWGGLNKDERMQVYAYFSLIGLDGDWNKIGQEFYFYYLKVFEREDFTQRYLLRRKIKVYKNSQDSYFAKLALTKYQKDSGQKHKVSVDIAKPSEGYIKEKQLGYLLPYSQGGFKPLYECYAPSWDDYMISASDPSVYNWEHCENPDGDRFIRTIGWVSETQTDQANVPLYRCFDDVNLDHFASTDPTCNGETKESILGYLFSESFKEADTCQHDYTGDGTINISDALYILAHWATVGIDGFLGILSGWGVSCG